MRHSEKYRRIVLLYMVIGFFSATPFRGFAGDEKTEALEEQAFKQVAALAGASVVRIQTVGGLDRVGQVLTGTGPTTGVVVSEDGYIISSAFNFASKPASILVQLPDGRRFSTRQVATDRLKMLTLLKIETTDLVPAEPAAKEAVRVGQWAIALGRTFNLQSPSLSVGIVSALDRIWGKAIQTDAKVSPVNYGGPLVDIQGQTMGVLVPLSTQGAGETAGVEWYDSGIGFAIPMQDVYAVLPRLKAGEDLHPGLMGISFRGRNLLGGASVIDRVRIESPADKAGFKSGDVIVKVDNRAVGRQAEVKQVLGSRYAGETIKLAVKRGDETIAEELTLVDKLLAYESGFLGILPVREAAETEIIGVGVRYIYPGSPAEKANLAPRDRIVRFNDQPVVDAAALLDLVSRLRPGEKAQLVFARAGEQQPLELELAPVPDGVPVGLLSSDIPSLQRPFDENNKDETAKQPDAADPENEGLKTGRFTVEMPNHEHSYWAYVPKDYNPDYVYGLMVWIHPDGDTMEASVFKQWKPICDQRGLMIISPKAQKIGGWSPHEAEFVKDALEQFAKQYPVDPGRVFLHSFSSGGRFAYRLAFKYRELFHGLAMVAAPLQEPPPENAPDYRLQFHLVCGEKDSLYRAVQQTVGGLRRLKFPISFRSIVGWDHKYPPDEQVREIARWADCLDRI